MRSAAAGLASIGLAVLAAGAGTVASAREFQDGAPVEVLDASDPNTGFEFGPEIPAADALPPVQGVCFLVFDVTPEGRVRWSSIEAQCDDEQHVDAAKEMILWRRFEPLIVDGEPQAQTGQTLELRFRSAG